MNLNELVKEYRLLQDEEGRYYKLDENSNRVEPFVDISFLVELSGLHVRTITRYLKSLNPRKCRSLSGRIVNIYDFNQVIQICPAILQLKHNISSLNNYVLIKGEKYAPISFLAQEFNLNARTIREYVKDLIPVKAKPLKGRHVKLYKVNEVKAVCASLIDSQIVIVDNNGLAIVNGEHYASLAEIVKKLKISKHNIKKFAKDLTPIKGKPHRGRLCVLYNLNQVKIACADLLTPGLLIADKDGWVTKNGQNYSSLSTIAKELKISTEAVEKRVNKLATIKGKNRNGRLVEFYRFDQVKSACADILDQGGKQKNLGSCDSLSAIARSLKISAYHLKIRAKFLTYCRGKDRSGRVSNLYSLEQIRSVCADLLNDDLLNADKAGFANKDGQLYTTINVAAKELNISKTAVKSRVKKLMPIKGRARRGRLIDFYSFDQVKSACADLLIPGILFAANNGWAIKAGKKFAPICIIAKSLKISTNAINRRIKDLPSLPGKSSNNLIAKFYSLDDVKAACTDLLIKKKRNK